MDPGHEGIKGGVLILTEIEERRIVPSKQRIRREMAFIRMAHFRPTKPFRYANTFAELGEVHQGK